MKKTHFLIIAGLFLLYGIANYFWLLQNKLLSYDEGAHLWTSLRFVRAFVQPTHNILYELFYANTTHWPPLFYFIASLFNIIFGVSYLASVMTNMLFFLVLIVSLYLIGKKIYSPEVGILASSIVSLYPIIYGHSRLFQLDFALTAVVTFSVYCLLSSNRFRNPYWSIIFAISFGLGMLIKWSYIFFIFPLFIYVGIEYVIDSKNKKFLHKIKKVLLISVVAFFTSSVWYLMRADRSILALKFLIAKFNNYTFYPREEIEWFILTFNNAMLSFSFFLLFIICFTFFYTNAKSRYKFFITIWYLIPLLLLTFVTLKQARFFMPILPAFALISASGLELIKHRKLKNAIIILVISLGLVQFFSASFNKNINNLKWHRAIDMVYKPYLEDYYSIVGAAPPHTTDWRYVDIAQSFARRIQEFNGYPLVIGVIYEQNDVGLHRLFSSHVVSYYITKELINSDVVFLNTVTPVLKGFVFIELIADMQGLLYISKGRRWPSFNDIYGFDGSQAWSNSLMKDERLVKLINSSKRFHLIDTIALPDNYYANLYLYNIPEIRKGDITIKIFNGKIKIFYKGKEITNDVGIVSKVAYNNISYEYKDPVVYNISANQLEMKARWSDLDVTQSTIVSVSQDNKNTIDIKVKLESQEDIVLDDWYTNSLISKEYKEWIRPFLKGIFKEISMFSDPNNFELLDPGHKETNIIGIKENTRAGLPAMLFQCHNTETMVYASVWNSTYFHNSRCVSIGTGGPKVAQIALSAGIPREILNLRISVLDDLSLEKIISGIEEKFSRDAE